MSVVLYIRPPRINGKQEPYRLADPKNSEQGTYTLRCDVDGKRWWVTIAGSRWMRVYGKETAYWKHARAEQNHYEAMELRGELRPPDLGRGEEAMRKIRIRLRLQHVSRAGGLRDAFTLVTLVFIPR